MTETSPEGDLDDVFSVLANDTRIEILRALWDARVAHPEDIDGPVQNPIPFSKLRERVGVRDSGRFNYHLDELVPRFVQHRDDGYALTHAGARIVGAAVSGVYTETETELDATAMEDCAESGCDGTMEARYGNGHVTVECDTCEVRTIMAAPPILVGAHGLETALDTLQRFTLTETQKTIRGFCTLCSGPVDASVIRSRSDGEERSDGRVTVIHECRECGSVSHTSPVVLLLDHPAVVSLLYDAGIDYREIALWRLPRIVDYDETIRNDDPVRVAVTIGVEDETLTVVLDGNLDVLEHSRS